MASPVPCGDPTATGSGMSSTQASLSSGGWRPGGGYSVNGARSPPLDRSHSSLSIGSTSAAKSVQTVAQLLEKLSDTNGSVRREAARALGQVAMKGDVDVIDGLLVRLADGHPRVRAESVEALAQVADRGDERVIAGLLDKLSSDSWLARQAAAGALARLAGPRGGGPEVVAGLLRVLQDAREEVTQAALEALAAVARPGECAAVGALLAILEGDNCTSANLKRAAAVALAQVAEQGDERAKVVLLKCLDSHHEEVRRAAIAALPRIAAPGDRELVNALIARLQPPVAVAGDEDDSADARAAAATLLGCLPWEAGALGSDTELADALLARAARREESWLVRRAALESLSQLAPRGDAEVLRVVADCLSDSKCDPGVRQAAAVAAGSLALKGNTVVVKSLLGLLGVDGAGDQPQPQQQMPFLRKAAVEALGNVSRKGDSAVVQALLARLGDTHAAVRDAAAAALARVSEQGDEVVVEALLNDLLGE